MALFIVRVNSNVPRAPPTAVEIMFFCCLSVKGFASVFLPREGT